jgi:hypothetical protein
MEPATGASPTPAEALYRRRQAVYAAPANRPSAAAEDGPEDGPRHGPDSPWGLALSGGGIRSATFSLGVVQAAALAPATLDAQPTAAPASAGFAASLLSRFDYLSTVSGGGYVGSFVTSLFLPGRLLPPGDSARPEGEAAVRRDATLAADAALAALCNEPPGRIRRGGDPALRSARNFPLAWLRENGRYLSPTGAGDMAYAAALGLRNWLAIHYVVGTVMAMLFSAVALLHAGTMQWLPELELAAFPLPPPDGALWLQTWWSPVLWLALVPLVFWALPVGLAFWFTYPVQRLGRFTINLAALGVAGVCVALLGVVLLEVGWGQARLEWPGVATLHAHAEANPRLLLWLIALVVLLGSLVWYAFGQAAHSNADAIAEQRVLTTRQLMWGLGVTAAILALGLVDTAALSLYLSATRADSHARLLAPAGAAALLAWLVKRAASLLASSSNEITAATTGWAGRLPWALIGGAIGITIFVLLAIVWAYAVAWVVWDGQVPEPGEIGPGTWVVRGLLFVGMLALAWLTGQFPGFINLSSLQSFYAARLTRAYLGASNRARFQNRAPGRGAGHMLSAAEPVPGDDVRLEQFWDAKALRPTTLAPLHLINVALNNTVDPAEQLVQRDRKGQPLAVSALGFAVDGRLNAFSSRGTHIEIAKPRSVGQWVATSGAAVATGIGRQTSLGMSLLMGAANVRLGTWWESRAHGAASADHGLARIFKTQAYLLDEFSAKFYGLRRRWQYLSDGGHFENTGLYELLRPERRMAFMVAVDCGSDPDYRFGDLANLIRLARIDHQVEVSVDEAAAADPDLRPVFGTTRQFQRRPDPQAGMATPCALLLRSRQGSRLAWIVLIKPRVLPDAPADVLQYALAHPEFPQQSTADQFFDEAQWESYRKLGLTLAQKVFDPAVRQALRRYIAAAN